MHFLRRAVAASILVGGLALAATEAEAMPVQGLTAAAPAQSAIQDVYYRIYPRYGWRRPFYRRPVYAYGWRRPYGWRGYGPGYRRGWHNRRLLGSRAR